MKVISIVIETILKGLEKRLVYRKSLEDVWPFRTQHCGYRPEYSDELWRSKKTCSHLVFKKIPPDYTGVKNLQVVK